LMAERVRRLRNYGQTVRYHHAQRGINSRLDEIQAAVLAIKLRKLDEANNCRRRLAKRYHTRLRGVTLPLPHEGGTLVEHVYHLYVIRHPQRNALQARLKRRGVSTLIHYPIPNHLQPAFASLGYRRGSLPHTERAADEILSLPLYVGLSESHVDEVADAIYRSVKEAA